MKEHSFNTATITTIGMFTAVLAVLSILQIPMPSGVPITLQTFAVALCLAVKTELYVSCYTFCLALPEFLSSPV